MFVPAPNVVQVELIYTEYAQSYENVFHVLCNNGFSVADLVPILDTFDNWHNTSGRLNQVNSCALRLIVARHLNVPNGLGMERVINPPRMGAINGAGMPGNVTTVATWSTGLRGRSYRGRTYFVGMHNGAYTGNQITAATQTALVTQFTAIMTAVNTHVRGYSLVVLSKRYNNEWRAQAVATPITAVSVEGNLDSQRRRLTGPGRGS